MSPLGTFVVVLVSLSVPSICAPTMYTFSSSLMTISHRFGQIPRYIFVFVSVAILIPVAMAGALRYYNAFTDVISTGEFEIYGKAPAREATRSLSDSRELRLDRFKRTA
ncbi:hypothetical protein WOLCODRAFT_158343 [Wolfiporia cocos MD-104 SS10]|uniref:Uncharacterized protein n=1 Tax=Wolfiporia cocos (strain MD-104) TaxID=742152 RepID=A0A2H3JS02_WOLCO|nr:hypothetical protein WOLCODRAFT_158343 [Wolfiporia cocos MD-104 SS10]